MKHSSGGFCDGQRRRTTTLKLYAGIVPTFSGAHFNALFAAGCR
ncbi:hypothetical protein [Acetobacter sacchari]|nr:hypothetical protein [Acetobacter sacchari]